MSDSTVPLRLGRVGAKAAAPGRVAYAAVKRTLDIAVSLAALVLLLPLLALTAVLIKLDSQGPVLFSQERVGGRRRREAGGTGTYGPAVFRIYKFRSMVANADPRVHEEHIRRFVTGTTTQPDGAAQAPDAPFKLQHDPRVTRVGRWLRRTSLDELPQLFNVLRGDMSLVGPRPVPTYEAALYSEHDLERFTVPSGVTGLWQVEGRSAVNFEQMMEMDMSYIARRSLGLDLLILVRTIPTLVRPRGAA